MDIPAGSVIFRAATGLDANAIAQVQAFVRRRLLHSFVRRERNDLDGDADEGGGSGPDALQQRQVRTERRDAAEHREKGK